MLFYILTSFGLTSIMLYAFSLIAHLIEASSDIAFLASPEKRLQITQNIKKIKKNTHHWYLIYFIARQGIVLCYTIL